MNESISEIKRMDIYMADLPAVGGSVQYGYRPVVVVQNNVGNVSSPTVIVVPLTTKPKKPMPTHVKLKSCEAVQSNTTALCEQIMTISTDRLVKKLGNIDDLTTIGRINLALFISLGFDGR